MATKTVKTSDAQGRASVTITADPTSNGVNWSASVQDANFSYGGWANSAGSWTVTVGGGTPVVTASGRSYDFGSGVISSPYFPRSVGPNFKALSPGTYTATATFSGDGTTVGTATASVSFTVTAPTPTSYTVTYSNPNGSTGSSSQSVVSGSTGTFPSAGTRSGYTFSGWSPGGYSSGTSTPTVTGNVTYTATWSEDSGGTTYYSYSYQSNGGSVTPSGSGSIASGTAITLGSPGTKTGFSFSGWYLDSGLTTYAGNIGSSYAITADRVFYAKWIVATSAVPTWPSPVLALAPFIAGQAYTDTISVSNMSEYNGVYSISSGSLPGGISINSSTGALTGTVTTGTDYSFTVLATNSNGTASQAYSGTITGILRVRQNEGWVKAVAKKREGEIWKPGTVRVWSNGTWLYGS
jgi:uncharacterized repeat protein (TIGR02543 family)